MDEDHWHVTSWALAMVAHHHKISLEKKNYFEVSSYSEVTTDYLSQIKDAWNFPKDIPKECSNFSL